MKMQTVQPLSEARRVLRAESRILRQVAQRLGPSFEKAVKILLAVKGKLILSGVGKSGLIARKISATLSSTGTPALYLHPVDCLHGDLGILTPQDAALLFSRSGDTEELIHLVPNFRRFSVPVIGIMATRRSKLGKICDHVIELGHIREACPYNLAPTSSTTAMLALGDALAIVLLRAKGFRKEDFAILHQAGTLGRRLQLRVSDLMYTGKEVPVVKKNSTLRHAILMMTSKNLGITTVTDSKDRLAGILTDGDLRRIFQKEKYDLNTPVEAVMTKTPKAIDPSMLAAQALALMEDHEITSLVCVEEGRKIAGVIHIHDIIKAGVA